MYFQDVNSPEFEATSADVVFSLNRFKLWIPRLEALCMTSFADGP